MLRRFAPRNDILGGFRTVWILDIVMKTTNNKYIKLGDLDIYVLAIELSDIAWAIYEKMDWQIKNIQYPISSRLKGGT